ncbi:MAG: hypothetical protein ACT4PZ_07605 [Panacagrimonas sp.]
MNALTQSALALICVGTLAGCATSRTLPVRHPHDAPLFEGLERRELYSGYRLNMAAIRGDGDALGWYYSRGIVPPRYPVLDLAPSVAADTIFAPLVLLAKADDSIDAVIRTQFERYPTLRLTYEVPYYVMTAPFVAAIQAKEYLDTQITEFKSARAAEQ